MNLQKIKQKQVGLNELLQLHLNDLENTINTIVVNSPEECSRLEEETTLSGGLLYEIDSEQKNLERKIDKLDMLKQSLYKIVFESSDVHLQK